MTKGRTRTKDEKGVEAEPRRASAERENEERRGHRTHDTTATCGRLLFGRRDQGKDLLRKSVSTSYERDRDHIARAETRGP